MTGSQKKLLDDHVHAVMANEMASPPTYQQVEDEYINFFATDSNRTGNERMHHNKKDN